MALFAYKNTCVINSFYDYVAKQPGLKMIHLSGTIMNVYNMLEQKYAYEQFVAIYQQYIYLESFYDIYYYENMSFEASNFHDDFKPYYIKFIIEKASWSIEFCLNIQNEFNKFMCFLKKICDEQLMLKKEHIFKFRRYYTDTDIVKEWRSVQIIERNVNEPDSNEIYLGKIYEHLKEFHDFFSDYANEKYHIVMAM